MSDLIIEIQGVGPKNKLAGLTVVPNKAQLYYLLTIY